MRKLDALIPKSITRVFLVRHGESTFNEQGRCQGSSDESILTERGITTAVRTGQYLRGDPPDIIITSPLRRARRTAEIIFSELGECGATLEFHDLLKEIHLQHWEGLTFDSIRTDFAAEYKVWREQPDELCLRTDVGNADSGFKPVVDLYTRARLFWNDILPRYAGKQLLIVNHGGTTRALIGSALGLPPKIYHRTQHSNGGISILHFSGPDAAACHVESLNLTTHLRARLPKLKEGKQGVRLVLLSADHATAQADHFVQTLKPAFVIKPPEYPSLAQFSGELLRTGVVIAPVDALLPILMTALGVRFMDARQWAMRQDHITVLHYPQPGEGAVLQAFNIPVAAFKARSNGCRNLPDAVSSQRCDPTSQRISSLNTDRRSVV